MHCSRLTIASTVPLRKANRAAAGPQLSGSGGGLFASSSVAAARASIMADKGAVRNRKPATRISRILTPGSVMLKNSAELASMQPTPKVVAFVGPCRRNRNADRRANPNEPISANTAPVISNTHSATSSQGTRLKACRPGPALW